MGRRDKQVCPSHGGAQLRDVRQQRALSLTELAERLGYSKGYLSAIETGKRKPSLKITRRYEAELGLYPGTFADVMAQPQQQVRRVVRKQQKRFFSGEVDTARVVFGQLFRMERIRRRLSQETVARRLETFVESADGRGCALLSGAPHLSGKDGSWVSRVESGLVAHLDRDTVLALCHALDCDERDCHALLLAAGLSPYPPLSHDYDSWDALLSWYRCAAALMHDALRTTHAAEPDVGGG